MQNIKQIEKCIFLILLLTSCCVYASDSNGTANNAPPSTCDKIPQHIGFDKLGSGLSLKLKTNQKTLDEVSLNLGDQEPFQDGIPLPCINMLDVSKVKDSDIFDLKINKCTEIPTAFLDKIKKPFKEFISKDNNAKSDLKLYSFNPNDKETFLKHEHLKNLYGNEDNLLSSPDVEKINKLLGGNSSGCSLKPKLDRLSRLKDIGRDENYENYIDCKDIPKNNLKNHLEKKLKDTCAVSYQTNAVGKIFAYSTSDNHTAEQNLEALKQCVIHFSDLKDLKHKELTFKLKSGPSVKRRGDEFKTYDKFCQAQPASSVIKDLKITSDMKEVSNRYSSDIASCTDCSGVDILDNSKIGFFQHLMENTNDVCKTDISNHMGTIAKDCENKALSCSSYQNAECALGLRLEDTDNFKLSEISTFKDQYNDEIIKKFILPLHKITASMTDTGSNQNRLLDDQGLKDYLKLVDQLRSCVENKKSIEFLTITNPQPGSKYLAAHLLELSNLVGKMKTITDKTSSIQLQQLAKTNLLNGFNDYALKQKELYDLPEEKLIELNVGKEDCSPLARINNHEYKCEVSMQGLKKSGEEIAEAFKGYETEKTDLLERYKEKVSEKIEASSMMQKMERYLKLLSNDIVSKKKKDEMVELLVLHDELSNNVKDKNTECEEETIFSKNKIATAFGRNGKFLTENDIDSGIANSVIASDEDIELRKEIENLKMENAQMRQSLNANLSQMGGGATNAGMTALSDAMLSGFSTYASNLASINSNSTNTLISGFREFGSILNQQAATYVQALTQQSANFSQSMYNNYNSPSNAMSYSQSMFNQSMFMSRPNTYSPGAMGNAGWI